MKDAVLYILDVIVEMDLSQRIMEFVIHLSARRNIINQQNNNWQGLRKRRTL